MKSKLFSGTLVFFLLSLCPLSQGTLSAQEGGYLSVGLSAGLGGVQLIPRGESWDFGPLLGGRVEWSRARSIAFLTLDLQPFRAEGSPNAGDFRALYLLPSYAVESGGRRIGFGIGMGMFDFQGGTVKEGVEFGFVGGLSGSARIGGSYFLELGWRRIQNVRDFRANLWSLQLVRRWRL